MPLMWVSLALLLGLLAGMCLHFTLAFWVVFFVFSLILALFDFKIRKVFSCWRKLRQWMPLSVGVLLLIGSLGGLRAWTINHPVWQMDNLAWYNGKGEFVVTGWVSAAPNRRSDMIVYQLTAIEIMDPSNPDWAHAATKIHGLAQVRMSVETHWQYGDLLQFTASPAAPSESGGFSYRDYLAKSDIYTVIYHPQSTLQVGSGYGDVIRKGLIAFRERARQSIFEIFPQPESGLLAGILLGLDNDLPPGLAQAYRDTGVAHIIAISGFNMAILAALFLVIFTRLVGPYWAALISGILLVFYAIMVDVSASVTRALIMAVVGMGGHLIGRRQDGLNALCFTAAIMCLVNPLLLSDISFQLSFAATFGLVVFAQPMQDWLSGQLEKKFSEQTAAKWTKPLSEYFLFTLAAQFATLPVIAAHFGRLSVSSLLANPLVLPAQPAVMVLGALTTLAGMLHPLAGRVMMLFSWPFLKYTNFMVSLLAKIKGGVLTIHPSFTIWIFILTGLVVLLFFLRQKLGKFFQSNRFIWVMLLLGALSFSVWSITSSLPDGKLHLHLVRCDDEATLYLIAPSGETLAFDPRGNMDELASGFEKSLSPWRFHLDSVLITHRKNAVPLADLSALINIRQVLLAPASYRAENGSKPLIIPDGIEISKLSTSAAFEIESGLWMSLLAEDENGSALYLQYGDLRVLIPNGVDFAEIKSAAPEALTGLTVLVLGEDDISTIPPRVWRNLTSQVLFWGERSISPFDNSVGVDTETDIHLVSDGTKTVLLK